MHYDVRWMRPTARGYFDFYLSTIDRRGRMRINQTAYQAGQQRRGDIKFSSLIDCVDFTQQMPDPSTMQG